MVWGEAIASTRIMAFVPSTDVSADMIEELKKVFPSYDFSSCGLFDFNEKSFFSKESIELKRKHILDAVKSGAILWCVRGGYGAARFLSDLPKKQELQSEGRIIGYSDSTALLIYTAVLYGWKNIHGATLRDVSIPEKNPENIENVIKHLTEGQTPEMDEIYPLNNRARDIDKITCTLVGGNLSVVQTSLGTFWQIKTEGKVLMLEDTEEAPYKIDRMLTHMKQSGVLAGCKGIIFGEFVSSRFSPEAINEVLQNFAENVDFPVFKTNKFGHGKTNIPFIFNTEYELKKKELDFILK